ncbi:hypothetical protein BGX38DRAFT_1143290 [Terfezia claveryi]|nr:hypothetical protein BGX38DRAFT_1143290 [Terfezia claveryi]
MRLHLSMPEAVTTIANVLENLNGLQRQPRLDLYTSMSTRCFFFGGVEQDEEIRSQEDEDVEKQEEERTEKEERLEKERQELVKRRLREEEQERAGGEANCSNNISKLQLTIDLQTRK